MKLGPSCQAIRFSSRLVVVIRLSSLGLSDSQDWPVGQSRLARWTVRVEPSRSDCRLSTRRVATNKISAVPVAIQSTISLCDGPLDRQGASISDTSNNVLWS